MSGQKIGVEVSEKDVANLPSLLGSVVEVLLNVTLRIDDNGKPFRTSSITGRPEYLYWVDRAEWVEAEY